MSSKLWLWVILLVIPAGSFIVFSGVKGSIESDWERLLRNEFGYLTPAQQEILSLENLCAEPHREADLNVWCTDYNIVSLLNLGAILTGLVSAALIGAISVAGRLGRADRSRLLSLFRPGLTLTILGVIVLVVANGVLATGAIYYFMAEFLGLIYPFVLLAVGGGALIVAVVLAQSALGIPTRVRTSVIGKTVQREDQPELWSFIDGVARSVGASPPTSVVVGLEPNFYVTEADVRVGDQYLSGETLYVSLPLCRILSTEELRGIIAHEMAHFRGLDTRFSREFYPIYRGAARSLAVLSETSGQGLRLIATIPALVVLNYFFDAFAIAERAHSREREIVADLVAANVTSEHAFASALVKVHASAPVWSHVVSAIAQNGTSITNASTLFEMIVRYNQLSRIAYNVVHDHVSHPTDSHPSLRERLSTLGLSLSEVADAVDRTDPEPVAITLIRNYQQLEVELSNRSVAMIVAFHRLVRGRATRADEGHIAASSD